MTKSEKLELEHEARHLFAIHQSVSVVADIMGLSEAQVVKLIGRY